MAASIQQKTRDALADMPDVADLQKELTHLRAQVEKMVGKAASDGGAKLRRFGSGASGRVGELARDGEALFGDVSREMGRELRLVEKRAVKTLRDRPVQSIALAVGVGFALAFLLRR